MATILYMTFKVIFLNENFHVLFQGSNQQLLSIGSVTDLASYMFYCVLTDAIFFK